jgi:transcriptional pleiotropic regulator of transition state genes
MKGTGIVRKVDELGRIVIPKELREVLDIDIRDPLEFFTEDTSIILKKYHPGCVFCGNIDKVTRFKENNICTDCLEEMKSE